MSCSPEGRADFVSSLVFEGQRHTGAKGGDFAVFDLHVHLRDFGHAEVPQRAGCCFPRRAACFLPRLLANPDDFDDLVDGVGLLLRHDVLPYSMRALDRAPSDVNSIVGPHPSRVTPPASAMATRHQLSAGSNLHSCWRKASAHSTTVARAASSRTSGASSSASTTRSCWRPRSTRASATKTAARISLPAYR